VTAEQGSVADRKIPFPAGEDSEEFTRSLAESTQAIVDQNRARFIPPENILRFRHGEGWNIRRADSSEDVGSFKEIEVLQSIGKNRIMSNDLSALLEFVRAMVKELSERDERLMIETITRAAEQSGNEVSAPEVGSPAESFLEALKSIKFSADKEGNVSLPQLILTPEIERKMREDPRGQGPAFDLEVKAVQLEKSAEAVREELNRLSSYEGFDERR
jgi:hypothetical protein